MNPKTPSSVLKEAARPALAPKLRFPEFRGAEGWEYAPLGKLLMKSPDYGVNAAAVPFTERLPQYLRITDISDDGSYLSTKKVSVDLEPTEEIYLDEGDIVLARTGASVGKSYRYRKDDGRLVFAGFLIRVKPDAKRLISAYLANFLTTEQYWKWVAATSARSGQPGINSVEYSSLAVPLPADFTEQQKIADCLNSLDELIAAQTRKVDALKTHKKGLMQQLFPREGETQPCLRFPEFQNAEEWEESPLSTFILSLDAGVSVNSGDRPASKSEFGILKTSAVTSGVFDTEENKVVFAEGEQSRLKEPVSAGTIIISRMNTPALVGANAYVESSHDNLFLPDRLWAAKPRNGVSMRFLAFILGSDKGRAALSKLAKGSSGSMKNITKPEVLGFSVMAPSPDEQQRIATCLTSLDTLITTATQGLEALKTHKKGLMQQLFPSAEAVEA